MVYKVNSALKFSEMHTNSKENYYTNENKLRAFYKKQAKPLCYKLWLLLLEVLAVLQNNWKKCFLSHLF